MRFWITSFMILFALAKTLEWLQGFELTMPVFVVGGMLLAIASNYDKRRIFPFWPSGLLEAEAQTSAPGPAPAMEASTTQPASWASQSKASTVQSGTIQSGTIQSGTLQPEVELPPFNN